MRPRVLGGLGLLALLVGAAAVGADGPQPRAAIDAGGRLVVSRLPPLLADPAVRRHLDSGLTTSLVFQGGPLGTGRSGGAARVDVRLELWEEVYLVTVVDAAGRIRRPRPPSFDELARWWAEAEIVLALDAGDEAGGARQARVSLAVVPFSQAELLDTQRWLVESIGQARGSGRDAGANGAVGALIATSMQRRAVRTMSWTVPIDRRAAP